MLGWQGNCHGNAQAAQEVLSARDKLKLEARAKKFQTEREKQLRKRLAEVSELLGIHGDETARTGRNAGGHSTMDATAEQHMAMEKELVDLRKEIAAERQKAVEAMQSVKDTAENSLDVGSWTQKLLSTDRFKNDSGEAEAQFVLQTSGLCTKEEFGKKRKELKAKATQKKEKKKKKIAKEAAMLSFDVEDE
eukprot:TRINITY_DN1130_c0_g1_i2.p1 TRINITY_DN1130_c0_g1~~TRINITY_DN1130_c0_g1_i2.p1  ORF type:complete len:192 (+),score=73.35 TRINITY_DN1130_c0_g1_i2:175-750(+)